MIELEDHEGRFLMSWDGRVLETFHGSGQGGPRYHPRFISTMEVSQNKRGQHVLVVHMRGGYKSTRKFVVSPEDGPALAHLVQTVEAAAGLR